MQHVQTLNNQLHFKKTRDTKNNNTLPHVGNQQEDPWWHLLVKDFSL